MHGAYVSTRVESRQVHIAGSGHSAPFGADGPALVAALDRRGTADLAEWIVCRPCGPKADRRSRAEYRRVLALLYLRALTGDKDAVGFFGEDARTQVLTTKGEFEYFRRGIRDARRCREQAAAAAAAGGGDSDGDESICGVCGGGNDDDDGGFDAEAEMARNLERCEEFDKAHVARDEW